ncbi:DEAD/DEAH box helicase [Fervidobacterium thailandense]|uniref:Transcription-repair-coupling factor n=2 Tax=Fervidobacterium thailandense TaxID=1008305 RepID=A0A1E3G2J2_9BACT|nr:DEAD/DEAH box helicase [Fervidobacterium thailandense]
MVGLLADLPKDRNVILIVPTEKEANLEGFFYIPDYDVLPTENIRPSWHVRSRRIFALYQALKGQLRGVATLRALLHYVMRPEQLSKTIVELKPGDVLENPEELFIRYGYERVFNVREGGTFSIRGEIIDFVGPDGVPTRVELYDNIVEEIRRFDLATQRSVERLERALILPAREFVLHDTTAEIEPVDEQFTGKYVDGTILDYNVEFFIVDRKSVIDHFSSFERELRLSIPSDELRNVYRKYAIFEPEKILNVAKNYEGTLVSRTVKREEPSSFEEVVAPVLSEDELQPGDIVVHKKYGIAKFLEIRKVETNGAIREFMVLQFADAVLYVPIERVDLVDKYIGDDAGVKLDNLKRNTWSKRVQRVKKNLETIVRELVMLQHIRSSIKGVILEGDPELEQSFAQTFPYVETPDQLQAINDVLEDLASEKPMDRLLVGDAGYGKTEVAIRAIFRTVVSGKQAVLVAPTTVLAKQHFETLNERFKDFGIRVALLSRYSTKKEREEIIKGVKSGTIDVLVGTHSVFNDVRFFDLGLVVIDEEQKFGVEQKEHFKKLRANVNVLSMSATPIPRTLHMAISSLKDLSEIKTPPFGRKEVQVHIGPFDERIVRLAIMREVNRGGQVIYVHNRVNTLYDVFERLKEIVPDVTIAVIHGQQPKSEFKKAIEAFFHGKVDVLLCTTIIENGVDVPNANTIIVDDAHRYGLAQLYQLRGRVGRSDKIAFAYFFHPKHVSDKVLERLYAIKAYVGPGSGMKIALRDMEIRGIGAIFGVEQHGFINDVGLNYYLEMLNDAITEYTGQVVSRVDTEIEGIVGSIVIPEFYVYNPFERMRFYRRIASATTFEEIDNIEEELEDRFGRLPESVRNLLNMARLRVYLWNLGVSKAKISDVGLVVQFKAGHFEKLSETYLFNERENAYMFFLDVESLINSLSKAKARVD